MHLHCMMPGGGALNAFLVFLGVATTTTTHGFVTQLGLLVGRQFSLSAATRQSRSSRGRSDGRGIVPSSPPRQHPRAVGRRRDLSMEGNSESSQIAGGDGAVSRDEDLALFLRWASNQLGVKAPKLKACFVDGLRGLVATQNIGSNEEMVVVPSASALVTTTDQRCPFPDWVDKTYWDRSPWQVRLAVLLLREKQKGSDSELQPWITRLPESFGTPLEWSEAELSELHYPYLENEVREQRREWSALHQRLRASSPQCEVSEAELTWAMGVAYSRAFSGPYEGRGPKERLAEIAFVAALAGGSVGLGFGTPEQVANGALAVLIGIPIRDFLMTRLVQLKRYMLTPVVDLINHQSDVDSDVSYNYFYGYFAVTTQRAWEAGEQVFISYGPRSNDLLLQRYGFVEADNRNDVYCITELVDKLSALLGEDSVKVLRGSSTVLGTEYANSARLGRGGLSGHEEYARVMPALRLAVVKDDQLPDGEMGKLTLKDFSRKVSPANEEAAKRALLELCMKERDSLATDLAQDEAIMSTGGRAFSANRKMAVLFRMEKKRVLHAAITAMTEEGQTSSQANKTDYKSAAAVGA